MVMPAFQSLDYVTKEDEAADRTKREAERQSEPIITELYSYIRTRWQRARDAKSGITDRLLRCLRQRKGEYDPEILAEIANIGGSQVFVMLTAIKCRAGESWIRDIYNAVNEKPWSISPTPIPDLAPQLVQFAEQKVRNIAMAQFKQSGMMPTPQVVAQMQDGLKKEFRRLVDETAQLRAERMERKIHDQMIEGSWPVMFDTAVSDVTTYPCGFVKGPIIRRKKALEWDRSGQQMTPVVTDKLVKEYDRVSPFDIYPSPSSREINDGYLFQKHRLQPSKLEEFIGVPGYDDDSIKTVLQEYSRDGLKDWVWADEYSRAAIEDRPDEQHSGETIDALEFWGHVPGSAIVEWGIKDDPIFGDIDPAKGYPVTAWLIGNSIVRALINPNPLGDKPYYKASYESVPGSFWGKGVPELMQDLQSICNATARGLCNNMGIASGPQIIIDVERIDPGEEIDGLYPWKEWLVKDKNGMQRPAIEFFQPGSNAQELLQVFQFFAQQADNYTGIPAYTYGSPYVGGAGKTASGLSMLMNAASKGMKNVVANIDNGIIAPAVKALWLHEMIYGEDMDIKGDVQIDARGASALLVREQRAMKVMQYLQQTNNPTDIQIMGPAGRAELHRSVIRDMELPNQDIIMTREQIQAQLQQQAQMQQQQQQMQMQQQGQKQQQGGGR